MLKRTLTSIVLCIVMIPLIYLGGWFYCGLAMTLSYIAGFEVLKMFDSESGQFKKIKYIAPLWNSLLVFSYQLFDSDIKAPLLVLIIAILTFLILMILNKNITAKTSIQLVFNFIYTGVLFLCLFVVRLPEMSVKGINKFNELGLYIIFYLLIIVVSTDVGAYIFGRLFGKRKLCPTISPNKTVAGFIGGLITSLVLGLTYYFLISRFVFRTADVVTTDIGYVLVEIIVITVISIVLSLLATLGDLVASKLKRMYDIKDYGFIFPGHGGVMDRFDSTIFAAGGLVIIILLLSL